jgi:hypothetical protein
MPATKSPNGVHRLAKRPSRLSSSPAGGERPPTSSAPPFVNGKNNGRDDQGRFTPGHAGGPGRPPAAPANAFSRQLAENRRAFVGVLGPAQVAAIAQKILERALAGDMTAAKLALTFAVGKPAPARDPDVQDVEELHLYQKAAEATAVLPAAVQALPADLACGMVQAARPDGRRHGRRLDGAGRGGGGRRAGRGGSRIAGVLGGGGADFRTARVAARRTQGEISREKPGPPTRSGERGA